MAVCRVCLPTTRELTVRKVDISEDCHWCDREKEIDRNVIFECAFARTTASSI